MLRNLMPRISEQVRTFLCKTADEKWIKMGRNFDVVIIPNWSSFTELFPSKASFKCGEGEVESDRGTHNGTTAATVWSPRVPCYLLVFWV